MLYTPLNDQVFLQFVPDPSGRLQSLAAGIYYARVLAVGPGADCSWLKKGNLVVVHAPLTMKSPDGTTYYTVTSYRNCVLVVEENSNGHSN